MITRTVNTYTPRFGRYVSLQDLHNLIDSVGGKITTYNGMMRIFMEDDKIFWYDPGDDFRGLLPNRRLNELYNAVLNYKQALIKAQHQPELDWFIYQIIDNG